jgi:hypothetical protein
MIAQLFQCFEVCMAGVAWVIKVSEVGIFSGALSDRSRICSKIPLTPAFYFLAFLYAGVSQRVSESFHCHPTGWKNGYRDPELKRVWGSLSVEWV